MFVLACLPGLGGWAQKTVIHDPNAQVRPVKGYHGIEVTDGVDLYLSQGDDEAVVVSAQDIEWRDRIHTEVQDGILKIWVTGKLWSMRNRKLKAYISFTRLDKLTANGASDVYVDGVIGGDKLTISLSGASDFKGAVRVVDLQLDQSGASDVHITGTVSGLATISSSGASDVKGYDLVVQDCNAHASGASDIRVTVNRELNAHATGASSVYYKGTGVVRESHASGASNVSKKG